MKGGWGAVYLAEQREPVRRRVAVKIIKLGMDTEAVVARFEAERQALAMMDHPTIAKVLDAGVTETGRPFFVMEFIQGIKVTEFCDAHRLSIKERLELFVRICQGVQHAHQKGIVHRDLKPSNILVVRNEGVPVPKIIDFGIAKAIEGRLTDRSFCTGINECVGTPAYMSPEQTGMDGLDVDTRSDIYSLGVLAYELLIGRTPFELNALLASGVDRMRSIIREQEPLRPSARLSALAPAELREAAARRRAAAPKLILQVRGDPDWIVMKCLEKDRTRRYDTANGLAKDVQRFLDGEEVLARPSSKIYRFQKLVRRNRLAFGAGAVVLAALIIGFGMSTLMLARERRARQRAEAAEKAERQLRQQAQLGEAHARAFQLLAEGKLAEAEAARIQVLKIQRNLLGHDHPEIAASLDNLSQIQLKEGKLAEAQASFHEALRMRRSIFGPEHRVIADSLSAGGDVLARQGKLQDAEALHRQALAMRRKLLGNDSLEVAESLQKLARVKYLQAQHRPDDIAPLFRESLDIRRKWLGPEDPRLATSFHELGIILRAAGKLSEAAEVYRGALPALLSVWPADPEEEIRFLVEDLIIARRHEDAEALLEAVLPGRNENDPQSVGLFRLRGIVRARRGNFPEAEADFAEAIQLDPERVHNWQCRAVLLAETAQLDAFRQHTRGAIARFRNTTSPTTAQQIGRSYLLLPRSEIESRVAVQLIDFAAGFTNHEHVAWFEAAKALAEFRQGRWLDAIQWAERMLKERGGLPRRNAFAHAVCAMAFSRQNQSDQAEAALDQARRILEIETAKSGPGDLGHDWSDQLMARVLVREAERTMSGGVGALVRSESCV